MVEWPLKRESSLLQGATTAFPHILNILENILKLFWKHFDFSRRLFDENFEEKKDHLLKKGSSLPQGRPQLSLFLNISPTTQTTQTTKTTQASNHPIVSRVALWCPRTEIKVSLAQLLAFSRKTFLLSFVSTWNTNKLDWWLSPPQQSLSSSSIGVFLARLFSIGPQKTIRRLLHWAVITDCLLFRDPENLEKTDSPGICKLEF